MSEYMQTYQVRRVLTHHDGLKSFRFGRVLNAAPGQFVLAWLPGADEKPFALSGVFDDEIEITVKAVGPFTRQLMNVKAGDWIGLRGPFGSGFQLVERMVLVGGGIGNAPLRYLAQLLREENMPFRWVLGVKTAEDLAFREELEMMPECTVVSENGSIGQKGRAVDVLAAMHESEPIGALAASGPEGMLLAVHEFAKTTSSEIPVQLSFERYMKCAVGLCGQCCLDGTGLRICVEGPVLSGHQLHGVTEWDQPHRGPSGRRPEL
ncbi:MAG: dihydroorotate dehydrogenase electron transfer subunit [Candidatus Riflebacteria bacterium]|nr:dihydroorotate dehydrogenase electron transfer subunit [Candidatus Riflebacteria bacterium]